MRSLLRQGRGNLFAKLEFYYNRTLQNKNSKSAKLKQIKHGSFSLKKLASSGEQFIFDDNKNRLDKHSHFRQIIVNNENFIK